MRKMLRSGDQVKMYGNRSMISLGFQTRQKSSRYRRSWQTTTKRRWTDWRCRTGTSGAQREIDASFVQTMHDVLSEDRAETQSFMRYFVSIHHFNKSFVPKKYFFI